MKHVNNILIVGGLHGDEPTGIHVARYFQTIIYSHIHALLGNTLAIKKNVRYIETDLNRSFEPKKCISIEEKRACKIKSQLCKYNVIIDIHNTSAPSTTCAITTCKPNKLHLLLASHFCFSKIVIMPPSGSLIAQNKYKAISLEIAYNDTTKFSYTYCIKKIIGLRNKISNKINKISIYSYTSHIASKKLSDIGFDKSKLKNFKELTLFQKKQLDLSSSKKYYSIFFKPLQTEEIALTLVQKIK